MGKAYQSRLDIWTHDFSALLAVLLELRPSWPMTERVANTVLRSYTHATILPLLQLRTALVALVLELALAVRYKRLIQASKKAITHWEQHKKGDD